MIDNISKHISYKEACFSATATRMGIDNTPDATQLQKMKELAENLFEPLRLGLGGKPLFLSSFFRSKELNVKIGGAPKSDHMDGQAMDIDNDGVPTGATNKEIFNFIKNNLQFDKLINEFPDANGNPSWVHVSFVKGNNRRQVMISRKVGTQTTYEMI
jgi:zinc D-Ala-D-Ala carboxypeptidase